MAYLVIAFNVGIGDSQVPVVLMRPPFAVDITFDDGPVSFMPFPDCTKWPLPSNLILPL